MKLYPYERFVILSPYRAADIYSRLVKQSDSEILDKAFGKWRLYLSGNTFPVQYAAADNKPWITAVYGRVTGKFSGCFVKIIVIPRWEIILFLLFWCGLIGLNILSAIKQMTPAAIYDINIVSRLVMLLGAYVFVMYGWNKEVQMLKRSLENNLAE